MTANAHAYDRIIGASATLINRSRTSRRRVPVPASGRSPAPSDLWASLDTRADFFRHLVSGATAGSPGVPCRAGWDKAYPRSVGSRADQARRSSPGRISDLRRRDEEYVA